MNSMLGHKKEDTMQKIEKRIVWLGVMGVVCALLLTSIGCSEMGKRYITVNVESDPPGASVEEALKNVKHIFAKLTPEEREEQK